MTVVDRIDLESDDCVKVYFIDLSTDDDSVEKDVNFEEDGNDGTSQNVAKDAVSSSISEQDATASTSLTMLQREQTAKTSLSMVEHDTNTLSVTAEETMQPKHQEFLATSDVAKEATQSGNHKLIAVADCVGETEQCEHGAEVVVFTSMTVQDFSTSLLLTKQGAIRSSLREDKAMQSGNQVFVASVDCTKRATQSESTEKASGSPSMRERGATCNVHRVGKLCQMIGCPYIVGNGLEVCIFHGGGHPQGEPGSSTGPCPRSEVSIIVREDAGNAMGSTGIYNLHAQEESERETAKTMDCDFAAEREKLCQELSQNVLAMSLPPQDKEKDISRGSKFYGRKGKKRVNTSARECNRLSIVHNNGVEPTLHNGDNGFSVMGNVLNGTASLGINVLGGEVVMSNYQGCSKTSQGNTMHGKFGDGGSEDCMVEDCTNGAHGGTPLCIFHNSRPNKRCCAVTGCTKIACNGSQGRRDRCVKHGGGKRCRFDGCGKGAQGNTDYCIAHGGGRRCKSQGCGNSAQGSSDYCIKHGGGKRCKFLGCSAVATCGTNFCCMHRRSLLSGNSPAHKMMPAGQAKKAESSKRRNSHSVIGGRSQKRHNTNDYVNTRSFNDVETGEEKGGVFVCQNNTLNEQQTTGTLNSESGLTAGSPPRKFRKMAEFYT